MDKYNAAENYNSILNVMIGSKRINISSRGSYHFRNYAAIVSKYTGLPMNDLNRLMNSPFQGLTVKKLHMICKERNFKRYSRFTKLELIYCFEFNLNPIFKDVGISTLLENLYYWPKN